MGTGDKPVRRSRSHDRVFQKPSWGPRASVFARRSVSSLTLFSTSGLRLVLRGSAAENDDPAEWTTQIHSVHKSVGVLK